MLADLAALEKLAIGGDGDTHYYYRDVVEAERRRADALFTLAKRLRDCLRNLTDGTGDGYKLLIEQGRQAVIDAKWLGDI